MVSHKFLKYFLHAQRHALDIIKSFAKNAIKKTFPSEALQSKTLRSKNASHLPSPRFRRVPTFSALPANLCSHIPAKDG